MFSRCLFGDVHIYNEAAGAFGTFFLIFNQIITAERSALFTGPKLPSGDGQRSRPERLPWPRRFLNLRADAGFHRGSQPSERSCGWFHAQQSTIEIRGARSTSRSLFQKKARLSRD